MQHIPKHLNLHSRDLSIVNLRAFSLKLHAALKIDLRTRCFQSRILPIFITTLEQINTLKTD